jgi:hypothetical protein
VKPFPVLGGVCDRGIEDQTDNGFAARIPYVNADASGIERQDFNGTNEGTVLGCGDCDSATATSMKVATKKQGKHFKNMLWSPF